LQSLEGCGPAQNGYHPSSTLTDLREALENRPPTRSAGCRCRDLRECLLYQLKFHQTAGVAEERKRESTAQVLADAIAIRGPALARRPEQQHKNRARHWKAIEAISAALDYVRTLDPSQACATTLLCQAH